MIDKAPADLPTVKITGSRPLVTADGRVALSLQNEAGYAIAVEINQKAIEVLRRHLTDLEVFLSQTPGSA